MISLMFYERKITPYFNILQTLKLIKLTNEMFYISTADENLKETDGRASQLYMQLKQLRKERLKKIQAT